MTENSQHPAVDDQPAPADVLRWIAQQAIPLVTPEAGHGFGDMDPFRDITGDVPQDAKAIEFGLAFVGEGKAWLDAVELGTVESESDAQP